MPRGSSAWRMKRISSKNRNHVIYWRRDEKDKTKRKYTAVAASREEAIREFKRAHPNAIIVKR